MNVGSWGVSRHVWQQPLATVQCKTERDLFKPCDKFGVGNSAFFVNPVLGVCWKEPTDSNSQSVSFYAVTETVRQAVPHNEPFLFWHRN